MCSSSFVTRVVLHLVILPPMVHVREVLLFLLWTSFFGIRQGCGDNSPCLQRGKSVIPHFCCETLHLPSDLIQFRSVHCGRFRPKTETLLAGTLTKKKFWKCVFVHPFAHVSTVISFEGTKPQTGFPDLSLLVGRSRYIILYR